MAVSNQIKALEEKLGSGIIERFFSPQQEKSLSRKPKASSRESRKPSNTPRMPPRDSPEKSMWATNGALNVLSFREFCRIFSTNTQILKSLSNGMKWQPYMMG